jgi:glycosyltransferase involved in cell wall biosynthesis
VLKIATIIPAYKSKFIASLLTSLLLQTRAPDCILISDDSKNDEYSDSLKEFRHLLDNRNVTLISGPKSGGYRNTLHLIEQLGSDIDLVHLMMDDDLLYPTFYEQHLGVHAHLSTMCTVSKRWVANETGLPISSPNLPAQIKAGKDRLFLVSRADLMETTIPSMNNWLGEFSNMVIRKETLKGFFLKLELAGMRVDGLEDLGAMLAAAERSPIIFINEALGCFRINESQNSQNLAGAPMKRSHLSWVILAILGSREGFLSGEKTIKSYQIAGAKIAKTYATEPDMYPFIQLIDHLIKRTPDAENRFIQTWHNYLA